MRIFGLMAGALVAGCATTGQNTLELAQQPASYFYEAAEVSGDSLDEHYIVSTRQASFTSASFNEIYSGQPIVDPFIRAFMDKDGSDLSLQVYAPIESRMNGWLNPRQANYGRPLIAADLVNIDTDVDCSYSASCKYYETVGFDLDSNFVQEVVSGDYPIKTVAFRIKTRSGVDVNFIMPTAEIVGAYNRIRDLAPEPPDAAI